MTIDSKNKIFSASLLFRGVHNEAPSTDDVWEESIVVIFAPNEKIAHKKAEEIGKSREVSYEVSDRNFIFWVFFRVERIYEVIEGRIDDGVEFFSRYLKTAEVDSMLQPFDE